MRDKVNLCKQLDFVISGIDPGYSEIRSFIQKELHFSTLILNQMDVEAGLTDIVTYSEVYRISMKALNELERQWNQITVKTLLQAAASIHFDETFGQFYVAKIESYLVVQLLFKGGF